jgi:2-oxoisovalerate dehydrogenase E1 component
MPVLNFIERDARGRPVLPLEPEAIYRFGHLIRLAEQALLGLFSQGLLSGTTHTCIGQELCQMGVVRALDHPNDAVLSNHRNHGHFLTYSGDFLGLIAEVMGRKAGVCGGRGGSQHIAWRHFHSNGVQGGMTAIGAGEALARKLDGQGGLVGVFIGDGTLGQGLVYESLNLSSVWRLPVLYVIENNEIAQTTPSRQTLAGSITARGEAFGLCTWRLSDDNPNFLEQAAEVVRRTRESGEPAFLVIDTRRMGPHSKGDDMRDTEEMELIRRRDPLSRLGEMLPAGVRAGIEAANAEYMGAILEEANASPPARFHEPPRGILTGLGGGDQSSRGAGTRQAESGSEPGGTVRGSLNAALRRLLTESSRVLVLGEDLHDPYGGAFKVTAGLSTEFPGRVISTPISEAAITGCALGLALSGYRPVVEIMFADFLSLAMDQLYNHAVKFPAISPELRAPLVVRTPSGGRRGYGPTHSQSPENLAVSIPGLTVVFPSHRHDPGTMLENAVAWPHPVLFFEHKLLYGVAVSQGEYSGLAPEPEDIAGNLFPTLRRGSGQPDISIVTYGAMLMEVEAAVKQLEEEEELSVEVVVPCLLAPLPREALWRCLAGRPRVAIVEESHHEYGVGAEIAASLTEKGFSGKLIRIGTPAMPIPSARSLEADVIPGKDKIRERVLSLF